MDYTPAERFVFEAVGYGLLPSLMAGDEPKDSSLRKFFAGTLIGGIGHRFDNIPQIKERGVDEYRFSRELVKGDDREQFRWFVESDYFGKGHSCKVNKDQVRGVLERNDLTGYETFPHDLRGFGIRVSLEDALFVLVGNIPLARSDRSKPYLRSSCLYFNSDMVDEIQAINASIRSLTGYFKLLAAERKERYAETLTKAKKRGPTFHINTDGMSKDQQVPDKNLPKSAFKQSSRRIK